MPTPVQTVALSTLYDIEHGNKLDLNKMQTVPYSTEAVAFVGRSGERNGIVGFVKPIPSIKPYAAGLITVALGGAALASLSSQCVSIPLRISTFCHRRTR